jgi:eukaryotic-like serine/threonine-protein kinase
MTDHQLPPRPQRPAPRLQVGSTPSASSIPSELYRDAQRRVQIAARAFLAIWVVVLVVSNITRGLTPEAYQFSGWYRYGNLIYAGGIALALAALAMVRSCAGHPTRTTRLGLTLLVGTSALIGFGNQWGEMPGGAGVSWAAAIVLLYPAIVPVSEREMLVAGTIACSWDPLFRLLAQSLGGARAISLTEWVWLVVPNAMCVGLSLVPAHVVRALGRAVGEAREMGNYRLGELLGRGGMGEVYAASHRLLARPAAVKVILPAMLGVRDEAGRLMIAERFRREAEAAALLRSPHTIELYDFGFADDGSLFYAMELLEGVTLQQLVDRHGAQPAGRVIHLLGQACLSLAEAHQRGLVHRDVKPSNLMTCRMGTEVDFLKVLDFGLVKASAPVEKRLTVDDVTAGTPAFMAPEAIEGVHGLDHRADLYALGCVAYWLLSGRPVFDGSTPLAILVKHGHETPAPLAAAAIGVGADLEAVVFRGLEKDPNRRPADALELRRALASCSQAAQWGPAEAERWWGAHLRASNR